MTISEAVVLAAGEGKRLRPLTYTRPKCMINLAGKPILRHVIENLKEVGVKRVVIVIGYKKERILEYFEKINLGIKIEFVVQKKRYGTAAAFLEARELVNGTFFGVAGDIITEANVFRKLANAHCGEITAALKRIENPEDYGIANLENGRIVSFEEKPKKPKEGLTNCSIYVFEPSVFKKMEMIKVSPRGEYEVTDLLKDGNACGVEISDYWLDMGLPWQLFDANRFLLERLPARFGDVEGSIIRGKVYMEKDAKIISSYIEGPLYVGENSVIGPHSYVRGATSIGANCCIGDSTTVKNSIVFDSVNAKHLAYIGDSIVGERCNFGAGVQIANFRFDESNIKTKVNDVIVDTKRNKLGAIIGDDVKMGVLSSVMPGKMIGNGCWIGANVMVDENVDPNMQLSIKQELIRRKRSEMSSRRRRV
ncbi:MAG: sugar phosphate nucleotidyltransferase [Candidatus Anstonellales archaeon]